MMMRRRNSWKFVTMGSKLLQLEWTKLRAMSGYIGIHFRE
jgi:hypothetical protein